MDKSLEQQVNVLEAKIKILENENVSLAERAEEIILFSLVSENIAHLEDSESIFNAVLERIAILKNIPYCACYSMAGGETRLLGAYASFREKNMMDDRLKLAPNVIEELTHGAYFASRHSGELEDGSLNLSVDNFTHVSAALLPFTSRWISNGVFVFACDDPPEDRLRGFIFLLQRIVEMTVGKLDNLALIDELKALNAGLDIKVEERTVQLTASELRYRRLNETLEQRVKERTAELQAANEEMEAFTYSVSHDLRSPLRAVDGYARLLEYDKSQELDQEGQLFVGYIRSGVRKMSQLIDDLLTLSRISKLEMSVQEIDLSEMVAEIKEELHGQEPDRQVKFHVAPDCITRGDPGLLQIALCNLFENAWKFTANKRLTQIEFGQTEDQDRDVYYVRDNGAGFDMAHKDKLFGLFQRLHHESEFPGTGVGLVIVDRIFKRHGGEIWTEAAVDQGATFYFYLNQSQ